MKSSFLITLWVFSSLYLHAQSIFASDRKCKECHPTIYKEHKGAMHNNSTIFKDPIHKAVWDKHPANIKKANYKCAKCHTPTASDLLSKGKAGIPDISNPTHRQGISCTYCHRIEAVELGTMSNKNLISKEEKNYFGTMENPTKNEFHITQTNDMFRNGQVCMGCHSHKKNKEKLDVCVTQMAKQTSKENCITCHMPKVAGSASLHKDSLTHSYHGFPGTNSGQDMLAQYIDMKFEKKNTSFEISIHNHSPHDMLLHPLRMLELHVSLQRKDEVKVLQPRKFFRVLGKDAKPSPPWVANEVIKNTMIQGKENRKITYQKGLDKGDILEVTLGYYLVNPKVLVKFALQDNEKAKKFHILKKLKVEVK